MFVIHGCSLSTDARYPLPLLILPSHDRERLQDIGQLLAREPVEVRVEHVQGGGAYVSFLDSW